MFQPDVFNGWHDVLMVSMNLRDFAILNIHDANHCFIISRISKDEAKNLMQNIDVTKVSGTL